MGLFGFGRKRAVVSRSSSAAPVATEHADDTHTWGDDSQEVRIVRRPTGERAVQVRARVLMHPEAVYDLLINPENWRIFSAQLPPKQRVVVKNRGYEQVVDLEQEGRWRFLMFSGTFPVRLQITQNRKSKTIAFRLTERSGFMKRFDGEWRIGDFDSAALAETASLEVKSGETMQKRPTVRGFQRAMSDMRYRLGLPSSGNRESLVTLRQAFQLGIPPPPGVKAVVNKIAGSIMCQTLSDLQKEASKIMAGRPTLKTKL